MAFHFDLKPQQSTIFHGGATIIPPPIEKSKIELVLPILTLSEANGLLSRTRFYKNGRAKPEHWTEAHARHKKQKNTIYYTCKTKISIVHLPCTVKLVRLGPRELDFDNLVISQKFVRDAVAELLTGDYVPGRADGDKRITWIYEQEKSKEYGIKLEITW